MKQSALNYKKNELHVDQTSLTKLAKKFGSPFFVYSETTLLDNFKSFSASAKKAGIPKPLVCFALKSNSNKHLLKTLAQAGSGADIVSGGELRRALEAGIDPMKIVFSGVGKTTDEIVLALKSSKTGIYSFNVESLEELMLIDELARKNKRVARICLRLNPGVKSKTHKYISTGDKTHKFGLLKEDVVSAINHPKLWKHTKLVGLSVHIGSQLLNLTATKMAIEIMGEIALDVFKKHTLEFLDVGGGLGVAYHPDEQKKLPTHDEYMAVVKKALDASFFTHFATTPKVRVVFEPGRRIIANAGYFVMGVLRQKISDGERFLIVDGGMNDFMRPSLYDAYHALIPVKKTGAKKYPTHVVGPICETSDCFAKYRPLPELKTNDLLVLSDAGAYGFSMGSNYNLRGKPLELLITKKGKTKVINRPQKYKELK